MIRKITIKIHDISTFLYSSREPSELSQWRCYDDSTINIVVVVIIINIIEGLRNARIICQKEAYGALMISRLIAISSTEFATSIKQFLTSTETTINGKLVN